MIRIDISGSRLLIIEDNENDGEVLSDIFKEMGCFVLMARTGFEALKLAKNSSFDISLIDLELPDMNGITILRKLKKESPEKLHYIITGYGSIQTAINALNDGANGYFLKPIIIEDLMQHIQNDFEKKLLKQQLKESEKNYRLISENTNDLISITDDKWKFQYCNEAYERILGYNPQDLIGTSTFNLIHPEDRNIAYTDFKDSLHTGVGRVEARLLCKDGTYKWMESFGRIIFDEDGKFKQSIGISRDIIERKRVEQNLKNSEDKYRSLFEQAADSIMLIDTQTGEILDFNSQMNETLGYTRDEFKNLKIPDFDLMENSEEYKGHVEKVIREGSDIFETKYLTKSGEIKEILVNANLIKISGKEYLQSILHDISDRKKTERLLKESEIKYKEAYNKAEFYKDIFTHDINNIISNIKSAIELSEIYLKDPERMTDVEELYEVIRGQFKKGSSLVSNIRKLSKIEESVSLVKPVEINDVLKKEIDFMLNSYQTRELKIRTHGFEKEFFVCANDLLIDLFDNLLNNSIKYNDSQVVEIDVKISRKKKNKIRYIKLEFVDNGIGILDKQKDNLFELEYVKDISSKGLGIGLTLVKKIVESYKGEIWVENRIKGDYTQGSNFIVLIPEAL